MGVNWWIDRLITNSNTQKIYSSFIVHFLTIPFNMRNVIHDMMGIYSSWIWLSRKTSSHRHIWWVVTDCVCVRACVHVFRLYSIWKIKHFCIQWGQIGRMFFAVIHYSLYDVVPTTMYTLWKWLACWFNIFS